MEKKKLTLKTGLCQLLGIEYPIIQAGMGNVAGPELVAAVSNAGGLGTLSGSMIAPDELRNSIRQVRKLTDRPFSVNLLLQNDLYPPREFDIADETVQAVQSTLNRFRLELGIAESFAKPAKLPPLIEKAFEIILEEEVPVWSIGLGNPSREMVDLCKNKGMKVIAMVSTPADALEVSQSGVDAIVAQGSEAGGHRSTWVKKSSSEYARIGTLALIPQVIGQVAVPVVAAGGIVNGKGMLAALSMGAQGVQLGTRFVATQESIAPDCYKERLLADSSDNTIVTDVFTGMYARVLRNKFTEEYCASGTPVLPPGRQYLATMDIVKAAGQKQNSAYYTLYCGQGIDGIKDLISAQEVITNLVKEALHELDKLQTLHAAK